MTKPKYQIDDNIPGTNIYVRGIATLSSGKHRYFLQVLDNTMVFDSEQIDFGSEMLVKFPQMIVKKNQI